MEKKNSAYSYTPIKIKKEAKWEQERWNSVLHYITCRWKLNEVVLIQYVYISNVRNINVICIYYHDNGLMIDWLIPHVLNIEILQI